MHKRTAYALLLPGVLAIALILLYPLLQVVFPTLLHADLYRRFLADGYNQSIIFRTLLIALITTVITLALGLPLTLWIEKQGPRTKQLLRVVILFPTLTNAVVRNFAWIIILGKNGVLNQLLQALPFNVPQAALLYTNSAIVIGSVYLFLPIMVTTLSGSVSALNPEVDEAAAVLGAGPIKRLFKITIPQLSVGLLTGSILVFAGTMTAYTTPQLLGGNQHLVLSTLIYQQAMTLGNWQQAAVVAMILIVIAVLVTGVMHLIVGRLDRREGAHA